MAGMQEQQGHPLAGREAADGVHAPDGVAAVHPGGVAGVEQRGGPAGVPGAVQEAEGAPVPLAGRGGKPDAAAEGPVGAGGGGLRGVPGRHVLPDQEADPQVPVGAQAGVRGGGKEGEQGAWAQGEVPPCILQGSAHAMRVRGDKAVHSGAGDGVHKGGAVLHPEARDAALLPWRHAGEGALRGAQGGVLVGRVRLYAGQAGVRDAGGQRGLQGDRGAAGRGAAEVPGLPGEGVEEKGSEAQGGPVGNRVQEGEPFGGEQEDKPDAGEPGHGREEDDGEPAAVCRAAVHGGVVPQHADV